MPNCDYFATASDNKMILDFLFDTNECEIYELSSDYGQELKQFQSTEEVLFEFKRFYPNGTKICNVTLQILLKDAGPKFSPTKVELNPAVCNGFNFRFDAEGPGLIQLYLYEVKDGKLDNSHTNHINFKRASAYYTDEEVSLWNFDKITKFSSKINRFIKKKSVAKHGSRVILPDALDLWKQDIKLGFYSPTSKEIELKKV